MQQGGAAVAAERKQRRQRKGEPQCSEIQSAGTVQGRGRRHAEERTGAEKGRAPAQLRVEHRRGAPALRRGEAVPAKKKVLSKRVGICVLMEFTHVGILNTIVKQVTGDKQ